VVVPSIDCQKGQQYYVMHIGQRSMVSGSLLTARWHVIFMAQRRLCDSDISEYILLEHSYDGFNYHLRYFKVLQGTVGDRECASPQTHFAA